MLSMTHLAEMIYQKAADEGNITQAPNDAHMLASRLSTLSQGTKSTGLGNSLSECRQDVKKFHAALQVHTQAVETANKVFQGTFQDSKSHSFNELLQSLSTLLTAYERSYAVHYEVTGQTGLDQLEGDLELPELREHETLPEEVSKEAAAVLYKLTLDKSHEAAREAYDKLPEGIRKNSEANTWTEEDYPKILKFLKAVNKEEAHIKALAEAELPDPALLPTLPPGAENRYDALRGRQAAVKEVLLLKNTLDEKITAHRKQLQATSEESETKLTEAQKRNTNAQSAYKELQNKASEIKLNVENTKRGNEQGAERLSTYVGQQQKLLGTLDQAYKELEQNTGSNANEMWQRFQGDLRAKLGEKDPQKGSVAALRQVMKNSNELAAQKWHGGMAPDNKLEEVLSITTENAQKLRKALGNPSAPKTPPPMPSQERLILLNKYEQKDIWGIVHKNGTANSTDLKKCLLACKDQLEKESIALMKSTGLSEVERRKKNEQLKPKLREVAEALRWMEARDELNSFMEALVLSTAELADRKSSPRLSQKKASEQISEQQQRLQITENSLQTTLKDLEASKKALSQAQKQHDEAQKDLKKFEEGLQLTHLTN
jgi:hypothetical protein